MKRMINKAATAQVLHANGGFVTTEYDLTGSIKETSNTHTYDNAGNLQTVTDAHGITTTFKYDALNRIKSTTYSNEPTAQTLLITYVYDNLSPAKARLVYTDNSVSATKYTEYDNMGRVKGSRQTSNNPNTGEIKYKYNLSGELVEQTYPSGIVVENVPDTNGKPASVQSRKNQNTDFCNYAVRFTYRQTGAVFSMQLGNGHWESIQFNNGNLARQIITVPTVASNAGFTATQVYTYDSLNRIKQATETIPNQTGWQQTFNYDKYGNRNFDEANTSTLQKNCGTAPNLTVCASDAPLVNPSVNPQNNRLNGYVYDEAGNTTRDAQNRKYTYNAENKQVKVDTVDSNGNVINTVGQYFYDGDGNRIKKYATEKNTLFMYDASGKVIVEYSARTAYTLQISCLTGDYLGSPRINTDEYGDVMARHDYQPFGEETAGNSYAADKMRKKFTGYERDEETDFDFAQARYFNSGSGRFTNPDPFQAGARAICPQRWNRYVYAHNNPLHYTDPSGIERADVCH